MVYSGGGGSAATARRAGQPNEPDKQVVATSNQLLRMYTNNLLIRCTVLHSRSTPRNAAGSVRIPMHHSCLQGTPSSATMMTTVTTNASLQRMHSIGAINNSATDTHLAPLANGKAATAPPLPTIGHCQPNTDLLITRDEANLTNRNGSSANQATATGSGLAASHDQQQHLVKRWTTGGRSRDHVRAEGSGNVDVRRSFS